jgi:hypothetical protein
MSIRHRLAELMAWLVTVAICLLAIAEEATRHHIIHR